MAFYWTDPTITRSMARKRRKDQPGLALVIALICGGILAGVFVLLAVWFVLATVLA